MKLRVQVEVACTTILQRSNVLMLCLLREPVLMKIV